MKLKALWYCTKVKGKNYYLRKLENGKYCIGRDKVNSLNGKIVAESDFEVEEVYFYQDCGYTFKLCETELLKHSCLSYEQLKDYLLKDYLHGYDGYAIHIENLYKFIKPKELKDLYIKGAYHNAEQMFTDEIQIDGEWFHPMKKAPQNMCYVYDKDGNKYVLISVHPEWLCLILNGLKDVEVRREVLKEMKE